MYLEYIESNILREDISRRGGGIELDLNCIKDGYRMTAYQNYLGGGILGHICNSYNFEINSLSKNKQTKLNKITDELNKYFYCISNGLATDYDEWNNLSFEQVQNMPVSAY